MLRISRWTPLLLAGLVTACTGGRGWPFHPSEQLMFEDTFDQENGGVFQLNYTGFTHWDVLDGTVDLIGTYPYDDFLPNSHRMYVDLDGTSKDAGTLRSKRRFQLMPGTYRLEFDLAGMPRSNQPPNTVVVRLGDVHQETITLSSFSPLQRYTRRIQVPQTSLAWLSFAHQGGDDYGLLLDNVKLVRE